jgi:hypothetical protein
LRVRRAGESQRGISISLFPSRVGDADKRVCERAAPASCATNVSYNQNETGRARAKRLGGRGGGVTHLL